MWWCLQMKRMGGLFSKEMQILQHDFNKDQIMALVWAVLASGHDLGTDSWCVVKSSALTLWNRCILSLDFFF